MKISWPWVSVLHPCKPVQCLSSIPCNSALNRKNDSVHNRLFRLCTKQILRLCTKLTLRLCTKLTLRDSVHNRPCDSAQNWPCDSTQNWPCDSVLDGVGVVLVPVNARFDRLVDGTVYAAKKTTSHPIVREENKLNGAFNTLSNRPRSKVFHIYIALSYSEFWLGIQ